MVQTSYPGIYIEEFTPPSPIQGVGTSVAAFIGTAQMGPVGQPTELTSWDQFLSTFGSFLTDSPGRFLAPAVYGFFLNGGTDCFVVRASTAVHATANLDTRNTVTPEPLLVATAIEEGKAGDTLQLTVSDSSYLGDYLTRTLGTGASTTLKVHYFETSVTNLDATDRVTVTVADNTRFREGEAVVLVDAPPSTSTSSAIVANIPSTSTTTITLTTRVSGIDTYDGGTLRSANLAAGQTGILVDVPAGASLALALPPGSAISLSPGTTADVYTVASAGDGTAGPTITLSDTGLKEQWDLSTTVPTVASLEFDLAVGLQGQPPSNTFARLSMSSMHPNYWALAVASTQVTLAQAPTPPLSPVPDPRPTDGTVSLNGGEDDDRATAWSQLTNNTGGYLDSLLGTLTPYGNVDIVCVPGVTTPVAQGAIGNYCMKLGNRFAILDSQQGASTTDIHTQVAGIRFAGGFAALYYPWILVQSQVTGLNEYWPPSGHLAGIYARTDQQQGVHVAPANASIFGALDLEKRLSDLDQGPLNLYGINVLRVFPGQSTPVVWGARTTYLQNRYWQYVNIRRLFIYLEQSIEQGIRWAVFQPNDQTLWQQLKRSIGDFLTNVWQSGALFGAKASDAFYVRIDDALNPESERALGRLTIEIGVCPSYPAEFIVVRIGIWQGGSQVSEG
jgi:phage tail sheath protein FI